MECAATMPREWHYRASRGNVSGFLPRKLRFPAHNHDWTPGISFGAINSLDESSTFSLYLGTLSLPVPCAARRSLSLASTEVRPT